MSSTGSETHPAVWPRLLLATEGGEFDSGAEAVALSLAAAQGGSLSAVLPIASNPEFESVAPQWAAKADAEAAVKADALRTRAGADGVRLDVQVRRGAEPYQEIVECAREQAADLLLIRRRGKRGFLANLLVGEMVSKVVAHAPCSMLIAPRAARLWTRGVLLGIDPVQPEPALLALACDIARHFALPLRVVSVAIDGTRRPLADAAVAAAMHTAREQGTQAQGEARTGRPHEQLLAATQACGADLLVIGRHGPQNLSRAWIGGVAQKVIGLAECPVLVHVPQLSTAAAR